MSRIVQKMQVKVVTNLEKLEETVTKAQKALMLAEQMAESAKEIEGLYTDLMALVEEIKEVEGMFNFEIEKGDIEDDE